MWIGLLLLSMACGGEPTEEISSSASAEAKRLAEETCDSTCGLVTVGFAYGGNRALCVADTAFFLDGVLSCPSLTERTRQQYTACVREAITSCGPDVPASCESANAAVEAEGCPPATCSASVNGGSDGVRSECEIESECSFGFEFTAVCGFEGGEGECTCESDRGTTSGPLSLDPCSSAAVNPAALVRAACGLY